MKFEKLEKHADLVNQMGKTLGLDMAANVRTSEAFAVELRNQVFRCMNCAQVDACETFLAAHPDGADRAPNYCQNRELFDTYTQA